MVKILSGDLIEYIPGLNKDDLEAINDTEGMMGY